MLNNIIQKKETMENTKSALSCSVCFIPPVSLVVEIVNYLF